MYMAMIGGWTNVAAFSEDENTAKKLAIKEKKKWCKDDLKRWTWKNVEEEYEAWVMEIKEGTVLNEELL